MAGEAFLKQKKIISFFLVLICLSVFRETADAFFKKEKAGKTFPSVDVAEIPPYRVFFIVEPPFDGPLANKKSWVQINYKLVNTSNVPGAFFKNAAGGKVRFLDKDGFVLASDFFLNEDFQRTDFYGSMIIKKKRASQIVNADAVPLRAGELELLQKERAANALEKEREDELLRTVVGQSPEPSASAENSAGVKPETSLETVMPAVLPAPPSSGTPDNESQKEPVKMIAVETVQPSPAPSASAAVSPSPEAGKPPASTGDIAAPLQNSAGEVSGGEEKIIISEPVLESVSAAALPSDSQKQVTAPLPQVKLPGHSPDNKKDLLDLGGATNDDVKETLSEVSKQPATKITESPSSIPGLPSEEERADGAE